MIGAPFAPFAAGLSIPIGAFIGGLAGYFSYSKIAAPLVQEGWTAGNKPKE